MTHKRTDRHALLSGAPFAAWLLVATGMAGLAVAGPAAAQSSWDDLDTAVSKLTRQLVAEGGLRGKRVLVTPNDFYEEGSRRRMPMSEFLSKRFRGELSGQGVNVVLWSAADTIPNLKGNWRVLNGSGGVFLSVEVLELAGSNALRLVVSADGVVERVDPQLLRLDIDFLGRDVVRQLERGLLDKRTVYVRPVAVAGEVPQPERLGVHLASWLNAALAQGRANRRLTALHPDEEVGSLPAKTISSRTLAPTSSASGKTASSLVGDMVRAESELRGNVDVYSESVRVVLNLVDSRSRRSLSSARVELDKSMLPPDMWKSVSRCYEPTLPANPDVGLELATTHGESRVTYRDGERIRFSVRAARPSHVYLFDVNSECEVTVLHPRPDFSGSVLPDPPLAAGKPRVFPEGYDIRVIPPYGMEIVVAVATADRVDVPPGWLRPGVTAADLKRWLRTLSERGTRDLAEAQVTVLTER